MTRHLYTVITERGLTSVYRDASYISVLGIIYSEYRSAGSNWDHPNILLCDGKVVVPHGLADKAWEFGQYQSKAYDKARTDVEAKFTPSWERGE